MNDLKSQCSESLHGALTLTCQTEYAYIKVSTVSITGNAHP